MKYVKPDFFVEVFDLNTNVAACPDTYEKSWPAQEVTCIISTSFSAMARIFSYANTFS